uniref:Uncharacterized protein n=1 Tax=Trichogramma kaykai TaxID=54128 RepID=A0ABD2X5A0_9HYME
MSPFTESAKSFLLRGKDKDTEINQNDFGYAVDLYQQQLEKLKSLRENIDWEMEESRREFLHQVYPVICSWKGQFPDLRNIFWPEEIDFLLRDSINQSESDGRIAGKEFINFVVLTGYKDEPEDNEVGHPRMTPLHHAARRYFCNREPINSDLFKIYSSYHVSYTDKLGFTHFHAACMSGYKNVVEEFITLGHNLNCFEHVRGNSPLHLALMFEHYNLVDLLLRSGANPNLPNKEGSTPLHFIALRKIDDDLAKKFFETCDDIEQSVQVDARDVFGDTPLHLALIAGLKNLTKLLLERDANPNIANVGGLTPLHVICQRDNDDDELAQIFFQINEMKSQFVHLNALDKVGNTPLHLAIRFGNLKLFELLLRRYADPNIANKEGCTLLHIICEEEVDDNSFELLFKISDDIRQKLHIDAQNNAGNTPLHLAVKNKNYITVEFLLRRDANPNLANAEGLTPMHIICETDCDHELAEMIFEISNNKYQPVHVNDQDLNGNTPLHVAAYFRQPLVTEILLRKGANPNMVNYDECTPLHLICKNQNIDVDLVKTFIEISKEIQQTVQLDIGDKIGDTPLHLAVKYKNLEVVELLLRNGANPNLINEGGLTPLHIICKIENCKDLIEKFFEINNDIQQTVQVDMRDNWGNSPLHLALRRENRMAAEVLLRRGADPNSINKDGLTPLHVISMRRRDNDLPNMLIELSNAVDLTLQLDIQDKSGNTPLHLALDHGLEKVAELLLINGADANLPNAEGFTALHIICQKFCDDDLVELFFKISKESNQPLQINARDKLGRTPLHLALQYGLIDTAELLLRNGANPNLADLEGSTSLHVICQREEDDNDDELTNIFFAIIDDIGQSVQVDAKDKLGRTPLQLAVSNLKLDVVEILVDQGADLSNFIFPTASRIDKRLQPEPNLSLYNFKLEVAMDALSIIKLLMSRGYELNRTNAIRIMTFFTQYELFEMLADPEESWYDQEEVADIAKEMIIKDEYSDMSLYDLIQAMPKTAPKKSFITHSNNFDFVPVGNYDFLSERTNDEPSVVNLRESNDMKIMSK